MTNWESDSGESIFSEDSDAEERVRIRTRPTDQGIWSRLEITQSLKSLPGGEELLKNLRENHKDSRTTGLLVAAWQGNSEMLSEIVKDAPQVDVQDSQGRTPLHLASYIGSSACVEVLLRHGASTSVWNIGHTVTPLHCAASAGSIACVRLLLQNGADVNAGLTVRSALHYAVQSDAVDCVKELLESGASPNTPQVYTETPLHVAAAMGSAKCLKILLEHGADARVRFGIDKTTALHLAAEDDTAECARLLIEAGADVNATNYRLQTPLHIAALAQSGEVLELLLQKGSDPNAEDMDGRTPLHSATVKICSRSCESVTLLLKNGANVNKADKYGYTPLHNAALNECFSCVLSLLSGGADMTARTNGNVSALSFIVRRTPVVLSWILTKLDEKIILYDKEIGDIDCVLRLNFNILVPSVDRGETDLLLTFIEVGQRDILKHPLCETFLLLKWRRIRKFFLFNLVINTLFAVLFSIYVINKFSQDSYESSKHPEFLETTGHLLIIFNFVFMVKELFQIAHSQRTYIHRWENWLQWLIIVTVPLCIFHIKTTEDINQDIRKTNDSLYNTTNNTQDIENSTEHNNNTIGYIEYWQQHNAAIAVFLVWIEMMMIVGRFPTFGLYVQMFTTVAFNFFKFLIAYSCLFVAFSLGFAVLLLNHKPFKTFEQCFMKTIVMMSGELDFKDIFYNDDIQIKYAVTAHLLYIAFVMLVTVILTNLLVGLAVNDIQNLRKSAGLDSLVRQAQLVAHIESMFFSRQFRWVPKNLIALCRRSVLLVNSRKKLSLYIRPNKHRDSRIPKELIKRVYLLIAERKGKRRKREFYSAFSRFVDDKGYSYVDDKEYSYVKLMQLNVNDTDYRTFTSPQSSRREHRIRNIEETLGQVLQKLNNL